MSRDDVLDGERLLAELLAVTGAQRATLRLDVDDMDFPVVAEAVEDGIPPIRDDTSVEQRGAATAQWIMRTREVLVQPDLSRVEPAPPPELVAAYGVQAQMLGPVLRDGHVIGWISVHSTTARQWSAEQIVALRRAAQLVARHAAELRRLDRGPREEANLNDAD